MILLIEDQIEGYGDFANLLIINEIFLMVFRDIKKAKTAPLIVPVPQGKQQEVRC